MIGHQIPRGGPSDEDLAYIGNFLEETRHQDSRECGNCRAREDGLFGSMCCPRTKPTFPDCAGWEPVP